VKPSRSVAKGLNLQWRHPVTRALAQNLIEAMVEPQNMRRALRRVRKNKGSAGVDGMTVDALQGYLVESWPEIRESLLRGSIFRSQ
jgi:RNA-directed DNA polymerase